MFNDGWHFVHLRLSNTRVIKMLIFSASPQLVFFLKVTPYPKTDGDYAPSVSYPIGSGYPLPYDQHGMPYGAPNIPSKNDSFNALDKCWFSNKTIRNMFIR